MPITEQVMDNGSWEVSLKADTPQRVLDSVDVRTYAYATIVVTPGRVGTTLTDSVFLDAARYSGVYLGQSDGRLNLQGEGLVWWLGGENDGGRLYVGTNTTGGPFTLADQLDARIFTSSGNGLTRGSTDALATTRTIAIEGGTTPRQFLDTICALYNSTPFEWRVNTDGTVDIDDQTALYSTTTTPTVVFTREGGKDGNITGVAAELELSSVDVNDYRTSVYVDWSDGTNNGLATNSPPSGWVNFAGGSIDYRAQIDSRPRREFQDRPNRWSWRAGGSHYAAWVVNAQTQADQMATRAANQVASYAVEARADIDEYDPWRLFKPGDSVYVYDQALALIDTANQVYYRGSAIHPQKLRVQGWDTPILEGYGVYLRRWTGSAFDYVDLSDYVEWEEGSTTVDLGTRARFHRRNARPQRINKQLLRRKARDHYRWARYFGTSP
jgi:hypothetical protein